MIEENKRMIEQPGQDPATAGHSPSFTPQVGVMPRRSVPPQLAAWNETRQDCPRDRLPHELVTARARAMPGAVALAMGDEMLTYDDLERRSNQLAHHLRALRVGPESLVGLCLHRSPALIVAALAILKAGGAYVPLDPAYPTDRLAYMLDDAQAPVLLTEQSLLARFSSATRHVLAIDTAWDAIAAQPATPPDVDLTLANLAYVI
jgi:non-ribosomal peptide synthetase component F